MTAPAPARREYKLGPVLPHVRRAAELVGNRYGVASILGWRASAVDMKGHPAGLALDFMCDRATGDAINSYLHANAAALGVAYTIWQQTYLPVDGDPEPLEDRGSPTANHRDHVHANFKVTGGNGKPVSADVAGGNSGGAVDESDGPMFDGWAGDLLGIGLKVAATGAALALLVTGVRKSASPQK